MSRTLKEGRVAGAQLAMLPFNNNSSERDSYDCAASSSAPMCISWPGVTREATGSVEISTSASGGVGSCKDCIVRERNVV